MPQLLDHKVDFYLNGHEHALEYAHYPFEQGTRSHNLGEYQCLPNLELNFDFNTRYSEFNQGESLHQATVGSTGYDLYNLCPTRPSMGWYRYANNQKHGFAHVSVSEREFTIRFLTIDQGSQASSEVYRVSVFRDQ